MIPKQSDGNEKSHLVTIQKRLLFDMSVEIFCQEITKTPVFLTKRSKCRSHRTDYVIGFGWSKQMMRILWELYKNTDIHVQSDSQLAILWPQIVIYPYVDVCWNFRRFGKKFQMDETFGILQQLICPFD